MEFFKQWTLCVCISLIVAVIFSMLAPKGSMNKFFRMLISVFIFISFLLPFQNSTGFKIDLSDIGIIDELQLSQNSAAETMIDTEIKSLLSDNGISGADVKSTVNYDVSSGEIDIKELQVAVSDEYSTDEVEDLIYDSLGLNARVINVGS